MKEILDYIDKTDLEDDFFFKLAALETNYNNLTLLIEIQDFNNQIWSKWEISAKSVRDYLILKPLGELRYCDSDHILIKLQKDENVSLYFNGKPSNSYTLIGKLILSHQEVCENWIPFDKYLNSIAHISSLLEGGHGLLAEGPKILLDKYAEVLVSENIIVSNLKSRPAKWWDGNNWIEEKSPLSILILGESYFIAEQFESKRIDENND